MQFGIKVQVVKVVKGGMFIMCGRAEQLGHSLPYILYIVEEPGSDFGFGLRKFRVPLKHYIF